MTQRATVIRQAVPDDALAVADVHVRSWQAAYRGLMPEEYLAQLRAEDRAKFYDFSMDEPGKPFTQVSLIDGAICGFVVTMPSRLPEMPDHGEICALYVAPEHWRSGTGSALMAAAFQRLTSQEFKSAYLWLLAGNLRGEQFYQHHGWMRDGTSKEETIFGVTVSEERFIRTSL